MRLQGQRLRDRELVEIAVARLDGELELEDRDASFVMRIRPYRSVERVVDGRQGATQVPKSPAHRAVSARAI